MPIIALFIGISPFAIDESGKFFLIAQLISVVSLQLIFILLVGKKTWRASQFYFGMFPAVYSALLRTILGKSVFSVSKKDGGKTISGLKQLKAVRVQFLCVLLGLFAFGQAMNLWLKGELSLSLYPSVGWLLLNTVLLTGVISYPLRQIRQEMFKWLQAKIYITIPSLLTMILITLLGVVGGRYFLLRDQATNFDENAAISSERLTISLDKLDDRLSNLGENKFQTFLFFIGWGENTEAAGADQFRVSVAPILNLAYERQMTPIITWEPKFSDEELQQQFSLSSIADGQSDRYLRGWRDELQKWLNDHPDFEVRIRLMHEMNAPIAEYPWSHVSPESYRLIFEHIFSIVNDVDGNLQWMLVFQNLTADANWQNKRAGDYEKYIPNVPIDYIGIDGYSRLYQVGVDGPPGGEVTPQQVLPEEFFRLIRKRFPQTKLVISETSVPYISKTDELIPYPAGQVSYQMTDLQRAEWITDLQKYVISLNEKYGLYEVIWFNGNTDYHWSLFAPEDLLTFRSFQNFISVLRRNEMKMGIYPGE